MRWWPSWPCCGPSWEHGPTPLSLCELGRRAQFLDAQLEWLNELIVPLVTARAPGLLRLYGLGPDTAAARADRSGQLHIARLLGWRQGINSGHRTQVRSLFH